MVGRAGGRMVDWAMDGTGSRAGRVVSKAGSHEDREDNKDLEHSRFICKRELQKWTRKLVQKMF